jgi:hypothetical protein
VPVHTSQPARGSTAHRLFSQLPFQATQPLLDADTFEYLLLLAALRDIKRRREGDRSDANTIAVMVALKNVEPRPELLATFYPHRQVQGGAR